MIKQTELNTLSKNDKIDHFLLIRRIDLRSTKSGSDFLSTELGDKTTSLNANVWEGFAELADHNHWIGNGQHPVRDDVACRFQEFSRDLVKNLAFVRYAFWKDYIEGRDSVGNHHHHQFVVDIINITDLAVVNTLLAGELVVGSDNYILHMLWVYWLFLSFP